MEERKGRKILGTRSSSSGQGPRENEQPEAPGSQPHPQWARPPQSTRRETRMQGSALLWYLNPLGHWGHLLAVSPQHSRSASSHSTERRGGPGGSLTPMGYDPKPYFSFLCCLRLSSLPPPSLPLVSSRSVMTFKFGLRCHTADPSTVKSVASGRQMAEGEAQHL